MLKKIYALFVGSLIILVVLISCGSDKITTNKEDLNDGKKVLNFWTFSMKPNFEIYIQQLIEEYEEINNDIKISWVDFSKDEIITKIYEVNSSDDLPDIVSLNTDMIFNQIGSDFIYDLSSEIEYMNNNYFNGIIQSLNKDSKIFGFPWYTDIQVLFVNKLIMDQASISEENYPKTEEELFNLAGHIKEVTDKFGSLFIPEDIESLIYNGINIFDENGCVKIDKIEVIDYLKKRQAWFNNWVVPKYFSNFDDKMSLYVNGEVGMIKSNFPFIESVEKISKEVYENTIILPYPLGEGNVRYSETVSLVLMGKSKNRNDSLEFIKFLTNEDNQLEFFNQYNLLPVNKKLLENETFINYENNSAINKAKIIAYTSLENATDFRYNIENYVEISGIIEKYFRTIYLDSYNVENTVKEAQIEIDKICCG